MLTKILAMFFFIHCNIVYKCRVIVIMISYIGHSIHCMERYMEISDNCTQVFLLKWSWITATTMGYIWKLWSLGLFVPQIRHLQMQQLDSEFHVENIVWMVMETVDICSITSTYLNFICKSNKRQLWQCNSAFGVVMN